MKAPSKDRKEWKDLLEGKINVPLKNFFFQMKVTQAKNQIEKGIVPIDTATEELQTLCSKFIKAKNMYEDLQRIFGENFEEEDRKKEEKIQTTPTGEKPSLYDSLHYENKIMFYKNQLEQKERELQEKNKLIQALQEDIVIQKKKNDILYEGLLKIDEVKKDSEAEKITKKEGKKGWSFFGILKNK